MEYRIKPEEAGRKVRDILRRSMGVSYTAMKSAKWNGRIRMNGEPVRTDAKVAEGDLVSIEWEEDVPVYQLNPFELPLEIPYEDEYLMAVVKPGGIASQSSRNHPDDSLENAVFSYFGCPENFIYRPVNRLDKGTGGLMIVAKTPHAQHLLQGELHTPAFRRRYLALTDGMPAEKEGILDFPIDKVPGATIKRMISPDGKPSRTRYRVLKGQEQGALILLELETGRTHQIRVHLSHIGCPVRGDFLYGQEQPAEFPGCFALHSAMVELRHPITGEIIRLTSLPEWADGMEPSVLFMDFN
ncbi:MAG: RluA family pseudouridine synthase [Clostridia bacterium]|nr:RluA family pseudouridine synthase [Clostridia bacterium]